MIMYTSMVPHGQNVWSIHKSDSTATDYKSNIDDFSGVDVLKRALVLEKIKEGNFHLLDG